MRGPQGLVESIWEKGRRRREIDKEEAELKKQLQPRIDALKKEILRLEKIERHKLKLIAWELREIDKHCPKTD